LHCSDTHLDKSFNIPNLSRAAERKEDLNRNFTTIIDFALKNKPDMFLVSGDVFDKILPTNSARVYLTKEIRRLKDAGIEVFMIGGNHEVPRFGISPSLAIDVLGSAGIATVFSRSDTIQKKKLNIQGKKVNVAGRSYFTQFEGTNPLKNVEIPVEGDFNILMIHGSLQGLNVSSSVSEMINQNPFKADDIKPGLNYLALGHFHNSFERDYLGCKIVNPGSIEKLSIAEINDEKGFVWAELSKTEVKTNFIKLETRPMEIAELTLSKDENYVPNIREFILDFLSKLSKQNKIFKLSLRGLISQQQYGELKINELLAACKDLFFQLLVDRQELEVQGYGRIFLERIDNPVEAFTKRLEAMMAQIPADDPDQALLEQVKSLGVKYLETVQ
jgi:exonuclease SbcD